MANRRSYRGLMGQPAWGLYEGEQLVGSCRAKDVDAATEVFRKADKRSARYGWRGKKLTVRQIEEDE